ncbi:MAG: T9SS type A sorting domain-containing protein [Bacteroidia bacterium]
MIRVFSTIALLFFSMLMFGQQLEAIHQAGRKIIIDQTNCTSANTCNDNDPNTLDICYFGSCAHTDVRGMPSIGPEQMAIGANGELLFATMGGIGFYDGNNNQYHTHESTPWQRGWYPNYQWWEARYTVNLVPIIDNNGDFWILGTDYFNNETPAIGRWDGSQLSIYSYALGDIDSSKIMSMIKGPTGEINLLHRNKTISRFDGTNWSVFDLNQFPIFANHDIRSISYDSAGNLWLMTFFDTLVGGLTVSQGALAQFDGMNWTIIPTNQQMNRGFMFIDSGDNIWLAPPFALYRYNGSTWDDFSYTLTQTSVLADIAEGPNGEIWLAQNRGLVKLDPTNGAITEYNDGNSILTHDITRVSANPNSNLIYCASDEGLFSFNGTTFTDLNVGVEGPDWESWYTFLDFEKDGRLWYRGNSNGQSTFYNGTTWQELPGLSGSFTDMEFASNGDIWLRKRRDVYSTYLYDGLSVTEVVNPFGGPLKDIEVDNNDHLWVISHQDIYRYDGSSWTDFSNSFSSTTRYGFLKEDANGQIWIWCTDGQIYQFDGTNWVYRLTHSTTPAFMFPGLNGEMWFGSHFALKKYENGVVTTVPHPAWGSILKDKMTIGPLGDLWGITFSGDIIHLSGQNQITYDIASLGFKTDSASSLAFTPDGTLWVSNNSGVGEFSLTIPTDSVWPGDANDDLVANNFDILAIGQAFGSSGPARPNASLNWQAQAVPSWSNNLPNGANYAHTDTDGSGTVDLDDTLAVNLNYGLTHNKSTDFAMSGATPLLIIPDLSNYLPGDTVEAPIILGLDTLLADSVYGIAFSITYDPMLIDSGSFEIDYTTSWLGDKNLDMITLARDDYPNAQADLALSRTDQIERTGFGQIAKIRVVMIDDISGKNLLRDTLRLEITNVRLIRLDGADIPYDTEVALVEVTQEVTGISDLALDLWQVFPNPAQDQIIIKAKRSAQRQTRLTLYNLQGQIVFQRSVPIGEQSIDLPALPNALYLLQLQNEAGTYQQKLQILR